MKSHLNIPLAYFATALLTLGNVTTNITVVDDLGEPVPKAEVKITFEGYIADQNTEVIKETAADGKASANGFPRAKYLANIRIDIGKDGYYPSKVDTLDYELKSHDVHVVLKRRINPVPMFARHVWLPIPVLEKEVGFDFKMHDWIAPYGKGETADCLFIAFKQITDSDNYRTHLEMKFKGVSEGILIDEVGNQAHPWKSELVSTRTAPVDGYLAKREFTALRSSENGYNGTTQEQRYIFRSRVQLDENQKMASYHYGKITDGIKLISGSAIADSLPILEFTYYLNPTPNDKNLEFDPKRNLFGNLPIEERVTDP